MRLLLSALREIVGLFVEDGSLALVALIWVGLCALLPRLLPGTGWTGVILFIGLAALLIGNVRRRARR